MKNIVYDPRVEEYAKSMKYYIKGVKDCVSFNWYKTLESRRNVILCTISSIVKRSLQLIFDRVMSLDWVVGHDTILSVLFGL